MIKIENTYQEKFVNDNNVNSITNDVNENVIFDSATKEKILVTLKKMKSAEKSKAFDIIVDKFKEFDGQKLINEILKTFEWCNL